MRLRWSIFALCGVWTGFWACSDESQSVVETVCGNLEVEQGEDCDSAEGVSGVYGCRAGILCGNGVQDTDEECDDGNNRSGDGCSAGCLTEGECGNGVVDPGEACDGSDPGNGVECDGSCALLRACGDGWLDPGETCDDASPLPIPGCDANCQMENPQATCGNGVWEAGERCDDGNSERHDGCHQCRWIQTLYTTSLGVATAGVGYDFVDGNGVLGQWDCRVDNSLGRVEELRNALTLGLEFAIDSEYALLISLDHLDDPRGENDDDITAYLYSGKDGDNNVATSREGGDIYYVREAGLRPDGSPITSMSGSIEGNFLDLVTDGMTLGVTAGPFVVNWTMAHARVVGVLGNDGRRITHFNGHIIAAVTVRSVAEFHQEYTEYAAVLAGLDPLDYRSFLALVIYGGLELGAAETLQPDADIDGDGLEQFFDSDPSDGEYVIDLCVDGDGTEIRGEHCVLDPRIQDAFSFTFQMAAVWVQLSGVQE